MNNAKNFKKLERARMERPENFAIMNGKFPPQAIDLEEVVLGAVLLEFKALAKIINILTASAFYRDENKIIYSSIIELNQEGEKIDILTVTEKLKRNGNLDIVGGPYYISSLTSRVASDAHIESHAYIILQKYIMREIIRINCEITNEAFDATSDVFETIDKMASSLREITRIINSKKSSNYIEVLNETVNNIKRLATSKVDIIGVSTGFIEQDKLTSGRCPGELVVIASRPGVGKTGYLLQEAKNMLDRGDAVGIFSLEMMENELINRILSNHSGIPLWKIRRPSTLNEEDIRRIDDAKAHMEKYKLKVNDGLLAINEISTTIGIWVMEENIRAVYLDYIQLARGIKEKGASRQQEIGTITRALKAAAKEYNIPIIAFAQLGRSAERNADKRPTLADLRESGDIENDADIVQFIFRPAYYGITQDEDGNLIPDGLTEIIFGKNRHGALGKFILRFKGDFCAFTDDSIPPEIQNPQNYYEPDKDGNPF
ncbi:MAG: Replicative DNA helicase [Candidatus Woesebacteria bacterium GW2011_GWA1_39_11b]|nr:MAG: Replicative DNA helicase [Candidatus Woesebacteria bacterium GW2011_GWA1_39_11b]KKS77108.1 MAG: Replicative DNA helicase [Candidatus Woesebacteria bacterium GW2011_GWC1_42_9]